MKVVIVGAGEVGFHIARQMIEENKDVVIIERHPEVAKRVDALLDCLVITGEGTRLDLLKQAGIAGADIFIAATTSDEVNLISCFIVGAEFDVPVKIARVRNEDYIKSQIFSSGRAGVAYLVDTDEQTASEIVGMVEQGAPTNVTVFENTSIQLRDYYVDAASYFADKRVKDLRLDLKEDFIIAGIVRNNELFVPSGDYTINQGDSLYMVTDKHAFRRITGKIGFRSDKLRRIAVVGGTPIGRGVAEMLTSRGRQVTLIDKDYEVCKLLADALPDVMVINGDISDHELYKEENIREMDAIVTTTQNEELNILSGLYAKTLGVKRAVAVVEKTSYLTLAGSLGIDSIVSPKFCAVNAIIKFIRRGNVHSVHSIFDGQGEVIEMNLIDGSRLTNVALKDLVLPPDCRIVAVIRKRKSIIPDGNLILHPGDKVIFFVKRSSIVKLEELVGE